MRIPDALHLKMEVHVLFHFQEARQDALCGVTVATEDTSKAAGEVVKEDGEAAEEADGEEGEEEEAADTDPVLSVGAAADVPLDVE